MKKIFFPFGFLVAALHLFAVDVSSYKQDVSFSCTFYGHAGGASLTVHDESGSPNTGCSVSTSAVESHVNIAWLRPRKQYTFDFAGTLAGIYNSGSGQYDYSAQYWLSFTAPDGYSLYLNGVKQDVLTRTFASSSSSPTLAINDSYTLELRPVASSALAEAGSFSGIKLGKSVMWDVGLGGLRTGRGAGRIAFDEKDLTNSPVSRDRLYYAAPENYGQVQVVYDGVSGLTLRQVGTPQTVVDLLDDAGGGYWCNFYTPSQVTWAGTIYTINSGQTPWRTIRVELVSGHLKITETEGSASRVSDLALSSGTVSTGAYVWTLQEGDTSTWLRTTTHTSTVPTSGQRDDVAVVRTLGTSGTIVAKTKYHYVTQAWDEEVADIYSYPTATTADVDALKTSYQYFTTSSAFGNYGRIQSVTDPTGNWVSYLYYDDWNRRGQVQTETRPYVDTPGTVQSADITVGNSIAHDYVADFSGRYRLESDAVNKTTNVQTGHVVTTPTLAQTRNSLIYTITQSDAYADSTNYVRTIAEVIDPASGSSSDYSFLPYTVKRPDLSQDSYAYFPVDNTYAVSTSGTYFRTNVWHGSTNSAGADSFTSYGSSPVTRTVATVYLLPNKSTMDVTIRNPAGLVVRTEMYVYIGSGAFTRMTYEDFTYDGAGRLTQRVADNNATVDNHYANGRLDYTVDVAGTRTEFTYDELGRVQTSIKKGTTTVYSAYHTAPSDITTTYTYDGANHVTQTDVSGGTHTLTTTAQFDLAGRPTQQIQYSGAVINSATAGVTTTGLTTAYGYTSGGKVVTVTLPGGATKITEIYLDGQLKSVTGGVIGGVTRNAVVYEFMAYSRDGTTGNRSAEHRFSSTSSPTITTATNDWLGRKITFVQPGWNGSNTTQTWHYNSCGQLDKFTQPGVADTIYLYDTLGFQYGQGLDISGNGLLDANSDDRISWRSCDIHTWDGVTWYYFTVNSTYTTSGTGTTTNPSMSAIRINKPANCVAERLDWDIHVNTTHTTTTVDRANKKLTTTIDTPDSSTDAVQVTYYGLVEESSDPAGLTTRYDYDDLGRPTKSIDPRILTTTTDYISGTSLVHTVTDPTSVVQATYTYDSAGRVDSVVNGLGKMTRYSYNDRNQKVHEWGDATYPVEYTYDSYGLQTGMTTYASSTTSFASTVSDPWSSTPNNPQTTTWAYQEATGLLASKTDAASHAVAFTYTQARQLSTRALSRILSGTTHVTTTYGYSSTTGELTSASYNDGTPAVNYSYNRLGQLATVVDGTSSSSSDKRIFNYDISSYGGLELQNEILPTGFYGNHRVTRGYETATGTAGRYNRLSVGDSSNAYANYDIYYGYDTATARLNMACSFTYTYLTNSNLITSIADWNTNWTQTRSYLSSRDLLDTIETKWSATSEAKFDYAPQDNLGRVTDVTKTGAMFDLFDAATPKGLKTTYGYNDRGEVISDSTTDLATSPASINGRQDAYDYDNLGNRKTVAKTRPSGDAGGNLTFDYNASGSPINNLNQYTRRSVPGIYDVAASSTTASSIAVDGGNMVKQGKYFFRGHPLTNTSGPVYDSLTVTPSGGTSYNLDAFLPAAAEDFTYDNDGNLTQDGRWVYQYDAENRLIAMFTRGAPEDPNAGVSANAAVWNTNGVMRQKLVFAYDYANRRVQKKEFTWNSGGGGSWNSPAESRFLYDGNELLFEFDGSLNAKILYVWGLDWSGTLQGAGGVGGLLICLDFSTGNWYSPAYDGNGNVMAMIKSSDGSIGAAYEYDAFGQTIRESGPYAATNPFRYSTKYTDIETGLVYYGQRYYSPTLGRFINKDPIEEQGGLNLYGFVGNNGVNRWDYLGMKLGPLTMVQAYADGGLDGAQDAGADAVAQSFVQSQQTFANWDKERAAINQIADMLQSNGMSPADAARIAEQIGQNGLAATLASETRKANGQVASTQTTVGDVYGENRNGTVMPIELSKFVVTNKNNTAPQVTNANNTLLGQANFWFGRAGGQGFNNWLHTAADASNAALGGAAGFQNRIFLGATSTAGFDPAAVQVGQQVGSVTLATEGTLVAGAGVARWGSYLFTPTTGVGFGFWSGTAGRVSLTLAGIGQIASTPFGQWATGIETRFGQSMFTNLIWRVGSAPYAANAALSGQPSFYAGTGAGYTWLNFEQPVLTFFATNPTVVSSGAAAASGGHP